MAKYEIEVWSKDNKPMGDIYHLCKNLKWSKTRNDADTLTFDIDLHKYEEYIQAIGFTQNPSEFMEVGRNDIRVKRNGVYIVGTNIIKFEYSVNDPSITMKVSATGYLNYYKKRYVTVNYTATPQEDILWGVIQACNAMTGGNYGITRGTHTGGTVLRDRNQVRKEVKSFFQQMSQVLGGCDFEFTPDKKLNTFEVQGVHRPDMRLAYPDNISSFSFARSVENVSNFIYGIGSGNGEDAIQTTAEDTGSEAYLYRRESIVTYNSVTDATTLAQNTAAVLHYTANPIELPSITVQDGALDYSVVGIGDTIPVEMGGNKSLAHINGFYRIESINCSVDENGSETAEVTFDDIDVDAIIAKQETV